MCHKCEQRNDKRDKKCRTSRRKHRKDKICARCGDIKHLKVGDISLENKLTSNSVCIPENFLEFPVPDGPFAVDHFQIGSDNTQVPTPFRYLVSDAPDLEVDGVQTIVVDDKEYFGKMEGGSPVYLSPPQPLIVDMFVPSTRENKKDPQPFYPEQGEIYYGENSLIYQLVGDATILNQDGTLGGGTAKLKVFEQLPKGGDNLAELVRDLDLSEWTGLQGVYLPDMPAPAGPDAYDRLAQLKAQLQIELDAVSTYELLTKIMGNLGVSVGAPGPNFSVSAADRQRVLELIMSSKNWENGKALLDHSLKHTMKTVKGSNGYYNPLYNFNNIKLPDGSKIPLVIVGDTIDKYYGTDLWEKLASYGIAVGLYSFTYAFSTRRVPGKTSTPTEIINRGNAFPDMIQLGDNGVGNYSPRGEGNPTTADGYPIGWIFNAGWTVGEEIAASPAGTGLTSNDFSYYNFLAVRDLILNSTDVNGKVLSDVVDSAKIGVYGRSGGSIILAGAQLYEQSINPGFSNGYKPLEVRCGVGEDIVLSNPFWDVDSTGYIGDPLIFSGEGGIRYPVLFMEPEVDHYASSLDQYADNGGARFVVGPRKALQKTLRKTNLTVRSKCIFMEGPSTAHEDSGKITSNVRPYSYEWNVTDGIEQPNIPEFPNIYYDPVYGFRDLEKNVGIIKYAYANMVSLFYRMVLNDWEGNIYSGMFNMLPFKFDIGPWTIPGALDYTFPLGYYPAVAEDAILFDFDVGGEYSMTVDYKNRNLRIGDTDEYNKPEMGLNSQSVNLKNLPTTNAGLQSGDLWIDGDTIKIVP